MWSQLYHVTAPAHVIAILGLWLMQKLTSLNSSLVSKVKWYLDYFLFVCFVRAENVAHFSTYQGLLAVSQS